MQVAPHRSDGRDDFGCSVVVPIRVSPLTFIGSYARRYGSVHRFEDTQCHEAALTVATNGSWLFYSRAGVIVSLSPSAIDDDIPVLPPRQVLPIPDIVTMIERAIRCEDPDHTDTLVFEIFDLASSASLTIENRSPRGTFRVQRLKRFIEDNAFEDIRLRDMAELIGLSPFVMIRQFKQHVGFTPYTYLAQQRTREAQRLLRKTRLSIEDVASLTGFRDPKYFSRFFRKNAGVTPSDFRAGIIG